METVLLKPSGAPRMQLRVLVAAMLAAVKFYDQLFLETNEIGYIRTHRLLTAEFESGEATVAQGIPELTLDIGLIAPKLACEVVFHRPPHPGSLSRTALSHKGRGEDGVGHDM